jgi:hypothetical protein
MLNKRGFISGGILYDFVGEMIKINSIRKESDSSMTQGKKQKKRVEQNQGKEN